ncbi:MAG TPA: radical SAM protein [Verrucomicrobiae bacterium]|nr:radical SAM protein [Verrucomicrobiae bacterium]
MRFARAKDKLAALKLASSSFVYPESPADRTRWILSYRAEKALVDPRRPYAFFFEQERGPDGELWPTATIFLTNKECPWRCLMCDLWRNTTDERVEAGAIPEQIRFALEQLPAARQIKLYNSGSFFDEQAIPRDDWPAIADLARNFKRVIVECHPALVTERVGEFARMIEGRLEVAMGLETAHEQALNKLNKRMSPDMFANAAEKLFHMNVDLRVFVLLKPPFIPDQEAVHWAKCSIDFALNAQPKVISVIPTRTGNGGLDELERQGLFSEPHLGMLEEVVDYGIGLKRARVFADLWDLRRFSKCPKCFEQREKRLHQMNCAQEVPPRVACDCR